MSIAIAHFTLGASIACLYIILTKKHTNPSALLLVYLGGIFAMLPDLQLFLPFITEAHHSSILANIFFGHQLLDVIDPNDSYLFAAVFVGVLGLAVSGVYLTAIRHHSTEDNTQPHPYPADD